MAQFNQFSLADTYGRGQQEKQQEEWNALRQKAGQREFDDSTKKSNQTWLAGSSKFLMDEMQKDPNAYVAILPKIEEEGRRRGVWENLGFDYTVATPETILQGAQELYQQAMAGLGGPEYTDVSKEDVPYAQKNREGQVSQVGLSGRVSKTWVNPETKTMWAMSPDGTAFDTGAPAQQYAYGRMQTGQGTVPFDPSDPYGRQSVLPGTDTGSMADAANRMKMAEGEGGRGRRQQPTGEFAPVLGTEADVKQKEAERKRAGGAFMKSIQSQTVIEDVDRFNKIADDVPYGRAAALQERLPPELQSEAYRNGMALIESVKGNVGIDSLLRIKASGAGLGQVPQSQLDMLSRLLGELTLRQTKEQFTHTWKRMGQVYEIVMQQADDDLYELDAERPNVSGPVGDPEVLLQQAREAIAAGKSRQAIEEMLRNMGIDPGQL